MAAGDYNNDSLIGSQLTAAGTIGARPVGNAAGVDISSWASGGLAAMADIAYCLIDTDTAGASVAAIGGGEGVELWGYILGVWRLGALLHSGKSITVVGAALGYIEPITKFAAFTRLAIAGVVTGGVVTYKFVPLRTQ